MTDLEAINQAISEQGYLICASNTEPPPIGETLTSVVEAKGHPFYIIGYASKEEFLKQRRWLISLGGQAEETEEETLQHVRCFVKVITD